jgi:hypothetical protein
VTCAQLELIAVATRIAHPTVCYHCYTPHQHQSREHEAVLLLTMQLGAQPLNSAQLPAPTAFNGQGSAQAAGAGGSSGHQQSVAAAAASVPQLQQLATIETGDRPLLSPNGSGSLHPHLPPPDEGLLRVSAHCYLNLHKHCSSMSILV